MKSKRLRNRWNQMLQPRQNNSRYVHLLPFVAIIMFAIILVSYHNFDCSRVFDLQACSLWQWFVFVYVMFLLVFVCIYAVFAWNDHPMSET